MAWIESTLKHFPAEDTLAKVKCELSDTQMTGGNGVHVGTFRESNLYIFVLFLSAT